MLQTSFDMALVRLWPDGDRTIKGLRAGMIASAPEVFRRYGITSPLLVAHVMAQVSHECGAGRAIVENLNPVRTPDSNTREVLVPGDTAIAAYREWLKKWDARGWKIDVKALNAKLGDVAIAIPCPARRTESNWVQEAVPLVPGTV